MLRTHACDVKLAQLLTLSEHERIAATAVRMLSSLNRPGSAALYIDGPELAQILGVLCMAGESGEQPIEWRDPFEAEGA